MIKDQIPPTDKTLQERGLPEHSFFEAFFADDSFVNEEQVNWSSFAEEQMVERFGQKQLCLVSKYPIKCIRITLNGLEASLADIPAGVGVFQFMQSERLLAQGVDKTQLIGRGIGLIKDGKVIEEKFINAIEHRVTGAKT